MGRVAQKHGRESSSSWILCARQVGEVGSLKPESSGRALPEDSSWLRN